MKAYQFVKDHLFNIGSVVFVGFIFLAGLYFYFYSGIEVTLGDFANWVIALAVLPALIVARNTVIAHQKEERISRTIDVLKEFSTPEYIEIVDVIINEDWPAGKVYEVVKDSFDPGPPNKKLLSKSREYFRILHLIRKDRAFGQSWEH